MYKIDFNCDLGESTLQKPITTDDKIIPLITSANVACGYHAGSLQEMKKTVALCKKHGVKIGAHPSYYDLEGFGRRNFDLPSTEIEELVYKQVKSLYDICNDYSVSLQHVKPHGALYNTASKNEVVSLAICKAVKRVSCNLIIMGGSGSVLLEVAKKEGLKTASEVFADRNYLDDGLLVPRNREDAMVKSEELAVKRVIKMIKENVVTSVNGKEVSIKPDTVCVHGDGEKALVFVEKIRNALLKESIEIKSLS